MFSLQYLICIYSSHNQPPRNKLLLVKHLVETLKVYSLVTSQRTTTFAVHHNTLMSFSFKAMWQYKCPRCRQTKIFTEPFDIAKPLDMPKRCGHCNQRTEPELGFYYGAMFISYVISAFLLLAPTLLLVFYFKWNPTGAIFFAIFLAALVYFKLLRGSRSLWLHINVSYDPKAAETKGA